MNNEPTEADRLMKFLDADAIRIKDGEVHVYGNWPRGDGGPAYWWKFAGSIEDVRRDRVYKFLARQAERAHDRRMKETHSPVPKEPPK